MQVFALPFASSSTLVIAARGSAVHQQACADVVSTIAHENSVPHCEQWLICGLVLMHEYRQMPDQAKTKNASKWGAKLFHMRLRGRHSYSVYLSIRQCDSDNLWN